MIRRLSMVDNIYVIDLSLSSTFQIGDTEEINSSDKAVEVQSSSSTYDGAEGNFHDYPIFSKPLQLPVLNEHIQISMNHQQPVIKVGQIKIIGISSSSILHVGTIDYSCMESRIKHIRHL